MAKPAGATRTAAAEPIAPWLGGKRLLAKTIIQRLEAIPHRCYAEPFAGMGGVFLRRTQRARSEIINDLNGEIVNLFRIVREHPEELMRQFRWTLAARATFNRLLETPPDTLTDIQRAARFAFLQRLSFGGKPAHLATPGQMGTDAGGPGRITVERMRRLIEAGHRRLQRVHIECLPWEAFIHRYDRPATLFYLDPPYFGHEADYGKGIFAREDFERLAQVLGKLKGRFLLSLNDTPEVRRLFAGFEIEAVTTVYSVNAKATRKAVELLIGDKAVRI